MSLSNSFLRSFSKSWIALVFLVFTVEAIPMSTIRAEDGTPNFGLNLYKALSVKEGNLFFSPYNVYAALAMAACGAKGETREEFSKLLSLPSDEAAFKVALSEISTELAPLLRSSDDFTLSTANALWVRQGYTILPSYSNFLSTYFNSSAFSFASPSEAVARVNRWVSENTHGKIPSLLSPDSVNASTRLILTSAIYMLAHWNREFSAESTRDNDFWIAETKSVTAKFMNQVTELPYHETETLQVVALPYKSADVSFWILLPKARSGIAELENSLDIKEFTSLLTGATQQKIVLSMPKFESSLTVELSEIIKRLGVIDAFDVNRADFSGVTAEKEKLSISQIIHQAKLKVDEKGTEAAAATAIVMRAGSIALKQDKPITMIVDHPFLYLVRENKNGSILFMGRLASPNGNS